MGDGLLMIPIFRLAQLDAPYNRTLFATIIDFLKTLGIPASIHTVSPNIEVTIEGKKSCSDFFALLSSLSPYYY